MVDIVIPRPPSTNSLWRMGNGRMFRSAQYMAWLDECVAIIRRQGIQPIKGKYKLVVCVRRPDKRRRDIDNVGGGKAVGDMLQKAGVVEDDCLCQMVLCAWTDDGPDTVLSICSEGEEHELSEAIARALQGGAGAPAHSPKPRVSGEAVDPSAAFGRMSRREYLQHIASRPVVRKPRKGNRI